MRFSNLKELNITAYHCSYTVYEPKKVHCFFEEFYNLNSDIKYEEFTQKRWGTVIKIGFNKRFEKNHFLFY